MKFCKQCGIKLSDDARFCIECGCEQELVQEKPTETTDDMAIDKSKEKDLVEIGKNFVKDAKTHCENMGKVKGMDESINSKVAMGGVAAIFIAIFVPIISIAKMVDISIFDTSKILAIILAAICIYLLQIILKKEYSKLLYGSNAILLAAAVALLRYYYAISKTKKGNAFDVMAGQAVSLDLGIFLLIGGAIALTYVGLRELVQKEEEHQGIKTYFDVWKKWLLKKVAIQNTLVPNIGVSISVAIAILAAIFYSK